MRFQVPQFIEIEDKLFGPLTFKQFIYVAGGVGIGVILFTLIPKFLAILISLPIIAFALALAFYKVNERPFVLVVESLFKYYLGHKLYIWKKEEKKIIHNEQETMNNKIQQIRVPKLSESKLKELTWSLDIKENQNPVTWDSDSPINNKQ